MQHKVAIIGAGPAGISCAIQLARYGFKPMLFEKDIPGGLLKNANLVENFPGFPGGISGLSLIDKLARQLDLAGVPVIFEKVNNISFHDKSFELITEKNQYSSDILVIASGTSPIEHKISLTKNIYPETENRILDTGNWKLETGNWKLETGTRFLYEVHPIRNVRDARIAIIGAGDAAFDYALQMSSYNKVYIFNRSEKVKCLPVLWHRAKGKEQVSYFENHSLIKTAFDPALNCLKLFFETGDKIESYLADYIIFAIGRKPELSYANPGLSSLFDHLQQERKLYFAGDVCNELFRQASIAAGDGIRTAMQIYFNENNKKDRR
jgi:thioredoxin reductase